MVSNQVMLQVSEQEATESDLSMSTMSNYQIMNQIRATHAHADKIFDVESLLAVVKNVLDNVLGTTRAQLEEKTLDTGFSQPLYSLKELSIKIKEGKQIFFYGGEDKQRKQQFTVKVKALAKDPVIENAKFSLGLFWMEEGSKGWEDGHNILLDCGYQIEKTKPDPVTQDLGDSGNGTTIPKKPKELNPHVPENWFKDLMVHILPKEEEVSKWIKNGNYSFFYGGDDDDERKQEFKNGLNLLAKKAKIPIKFFCVGKSSKGQKDDRDILSDFWNRIKSFQIDSRTETDHVTQEVKKFLPYKRDGWAVLCAGAKLIDSGNGTAVMNVLNEFDKWNWDPHVEKFESCFKDYYMKNGEEWFGYLMTKHDFLKQEESIWMGQGNHTFFYGGNDRKWKEEFAKKSDDLLATIQDIKNADISIRVYRKQHFSVHLFSAGKSKSISENVRNEIKKLESYKYANGWAMLCKGYKLKVFGETEMIDLLELEKFKSACA